MQIEASLEGDQVEGCVIKLARVVFKVWVRSTGSHIGAPCRFDVWQGSETTKWVQRYCLYSIRKERLDLSSRQWLLFCIALCDNLPQ